LRKLFSRLCDALFAEVIFPMAHVCLSDATYVLVKASIFLFDGFTFSSLSPEGKAVLSREKARHRAALLAHLNAKREAFNDKLNQIIQIEHIMTSIEVCFYYM
uniref:BHLH domain-containing protein n=1 Tax=Heligmosomoides polygyrus TaxID=6339 RepID=A0A183F9M9_HELPZ